MKLDIGIADAIGKLTSIGEKAIEKIPDENLRRRLETDLEKSKIGLNEKMMSVLTADVQHSSLFVAGWRPFIGWICGIGIAFSFLVLPVFNFVLLRLAENPADVSLLKLDVGFLSQLVLAMLGMAGLRTYEKKNGVERKAMDKKKGRKK